MVKKRGNVLFIILLGIALFAAVSAAIMSTSSGGKNIKTERAALRAQQIMRYGEQVKKAVDQLYTNGVSEADIRFASPLLASHYGDITSNTGNQVFTDDGGGLPYTPPPAEALVTTTNTWEFFGTSNVPQVGTTAADLVIVLPDVKLAVCQKINEFIGYTDDATPPVDDATDSKCVYSSTSADRFAGTFATGGSVNSMGTSGFTLLPAYEACVSCGSNYHYYKVLIER